MKMPVSSIQAIHGFKIKIRAPHAGVRENCINFNAKTNPSLSRDMDLPRFFWQARVNPRVPELVLSKPACGNRAKLSRFLTSILGSFLQKVEGP